MKTADYIVLGVGAVGALFVFNKLFGKEAVKETAQAAGEGLGNAVGGGAGGLITGTATGAIDAGKEFGRYLGFYDGWAYDLLNNLGLSEQARLGTKGYFPNGEVYYTKNGVQTPTDEEWLARHPEYRRQNNTNTQNSAPGNSISVQTQTPMTQNQLNSNINVLLGRAQSTNGTPIIKTGNNFATDTSGNIIGNLSGYATLAEARAYEASTNRAPEVINVAPVPTGFGAGKTSSAPRTITLPSQKQNAFTYISGKGWGYW